MPTKEKLEETKKKKLLESSKNCKKIDDLFKNNNQPNKPGETCSSTIPTTSYTATEVLVENGDKEIEDEADDILNNNLSKLSTVNDFNECLYLNICDSLKYKLLSQDFTPEKDYEFPTQIESGSVRKFSTDYLKNHNWLIYSKQACGAFCRYCVLFSTTKKTMNLISKPLNKYKNASTDFKAHENSKTHVDSFKNAEIFKLIYEKKNDSINIQLDKNLKHSIQITRNGLISITKTLIFLA
jgi:hypothetical protein